MQLLLEMQLVDRINLDDGCARYEIGEFFDGEERHHHHHLICRTCGKIIPFKDDLLENLEDKIEETTGFHVLDHELKFYGQCKECQKRGRKIVRYARGGVILKRENNGKMRIIPLGGLEKIGMNITAFEYEDSIIV